MKNLVLICGGVSPEHEISIRSARNILEALDDAKYQVCIIGIAKSGKWVLVNESELDQIDDNGIEVSIVPGQSNCFQTTENSLKKVDVVFPILHGPNGEDGAIQGLLQILNLPFVGPRVLGSSVSMDKDITKKLLQQEGIKVARWLSFHTMDEIPPFEEVQEKLGGDVFVKPANMGSSVGVTKVTSSDEWEDAVTLAFSHDSKILVEECIVGRELECAVIGNLSPKASGVGEVQSGDVYSYDEKYAESSTAKITIPAQVSENELKDLRNTAMAAYQALECRGLSRVDMFLDTKGQVIVNEVNTMPGFTSISMYPKLWEEEGVKYTELLDELIDLALSDDS